MTPGRAPAPLGVTREACPEGAEQSVRQEGPLSPDGAPTPGSPPTPGSQLAPWPPPMWRRPRALPEASGRYRSGLRPRLLHGQARRGLIRGSQPPEPRQLTQQVRPRTRHSPTPCLLTPWARPALGWGWGAAQGSVPASGPSPDPGRASPLGWCPQGGTSEPQATVWASPGPAAWGGWAGRGAGGRAVGLPREGPARRPVAGWGGMASGTLSMASRWTGRARPARTLARLACSPGLTVWVGTACPEPVQPGERGAGGRGGWPNCSPRCL